MPSERALNAASNRRVRKFAIERMRTAREKELKNYKVAAGVPRPLMAATAAIAAATAAAAATATTAAAAATAATAATAAAAATATTAAAVAATAKKRKDGVYRLRLADGTYYIGKANDVEARIRHHRTADPRDKVACLRSGVGFERVGLLVPDGSRYDSLDDWERKETLANMYAFGINSVRGWQFCQCTLYESAWREAFRNICCMKDLCIRCGGGSHFASECRATFFVEWTGTVSKAC
jgi:hypothetical protein